MEERAGRLIDTEEARVETAEIKGTVLLEEQRGSSGSQSGPRRKTSFRFRPSGRLVFILLLLGVAAGALALRTVHLAQRPMHTDEAVHAVKLGELLNRGTYLYNPREYHGPTLYYFTLPLLWLRGVHAFAGIPNEVPLRLVPALFGAGLILLLLLVADGLGRPVALVAAALTALSPAMVFFSRYYIQEILLVFFTFAAIASFWRYGRQKRFGWALLAGVFLGLMHATKETSVIAYGSMLGGAFLAALWRRLLDGVDARRRWHIHRWHLVGAVKAAALVAILFLTGFLTHWRATLDTVRTYAVYLGRAGSGDSSTNGLAAHNHPWNYYLSMLAWYHHGAGPAWSEGLILALAAVGIVAVMRPRAAIAGASINLLRFLAFYTILMTTVYSTIPYKTPWCLLSFLHGLILMAGVGGVVLWRCLSRMRDLPPVWWRAPLAVVLVAGLWNLGTQLWSEGLILALALAGLIAALGPRAILPGVNINLLRFLAFYTILMTMTYWVIHYKSPLCLLTFLIGIILLAGIGSAVLWRVLPRAREIPPAWWRAGLAALLAAGLWSLGAQAWRGTSARFDADPRNPYVYGHTSHNLLKLVERAETVARLTPEGHAMAIKVLVPGNDFWPLPWYLRGFNPDHVDYLDAVPADASVDAPLIVTSPELLEAVQGRARGHYIVDQYYGLRPDVLLAVLIRQDLWDRFLTAQGQKP